MSSPESKLTPRVVRAVAVGYQQRVAQANGAVKDVPSWASRDEVILLSPREEVRLDHGGNLMPPGSEPGDAEREVQAKILAYQEAHRSMPASAGAS